MITPYDWQEGIGNRAQYIEGKLQHGSPVLAVSLNAGILIYTRRRQSRKVFEIYDRLAFSAIGQQSDVEALRSAAVEFAHQEGYNRSEQDVTIQRVVTALSAPVKKAFADFSSGPLVARSVFAEIGDSVDGDIYFILNYDGDYHQTKRAAAVAGTPELQEQAEGSLAEISVDTNPQDAASTLAEVWESTFESADMDAKELSALVAEGMLVERDTQREDRFRLLEL
jgi:proteasome alpha subunit